VAGGKTEAYLLLTAFAIIDIYRIWIERRPDQHPHHEIDLSQFTRDDRLNPVGKARPKPIQRSNLRRLAINLLSARLPWRR